MHNEFTSLIEQDGEWFVAYSPEIPGANGQGRSPDDARENLAEAIALILQDRREDGLPGVPEGAIRGTVVVQ
ncbi:MAG TPA: type II toxin-antitoxin system HicB family antitoxin [Thermoanaerobaculia bacterium]|jgi:predicted RNase H-like HicB family nuclease|nr:type II toxin-antitoxin system HicB family antitoxin [Thermoanaerobaculia bacterium]